LGRWKKAVENEERMKEDGWKEWSKMPEVTKAEMVDWGAI
jgi:hypothetical protein